MHTFSVGNKIFNLLFVLNHLLFISRQSLTHCVVPCHCLRCIECHSTLLPGSYKLGSNSGALVCTHHVTRSALANQNGRPNLAKGSVVVQSARIGRSAIPHSVSSERDQTKTSTNDANEPANDSATAPAVTPNTADTSETAKDMGNSGDAEEMLHSSPPNPFDESDEEEEKKENDSETAATPTTNGDLPSTPVSHHEGASRPVPAPRRVSDPTPPPRPAPRVRLLRAADGQCPPISQYQGLD